MLQSLTIQNYALINRLEITFDKGFSVITGETGAGKSIILGALSLILGQRADARSIRQGADKCTIEALFDISRYNLEAFFTEKDFDFDPSQCIIRRELLASGKSRAFINDSPASLADLKELASALIDIHSQHQNLLLTDNHFQLQALDVLAGNSDLRSEYAAVYRDFVALARRIDSLKADIARRQTEEDYLRFQFNQLDEARLVEGEQTALEEEQEALSHVEEIKTGLYSIAQALQGDDSGSILSTLKEALTTAQSIGKIFAPARDVVDRLQSAFIDLTDLARQTDQTQDGLEYDPDRLQTVADRLDTIYSLQKKHRLDTTEELIALRDSIRQQLDELDLSTEALETAEREHAALRLEMQKLADRLTESRKTAATLLETRLREHVAPLGMPYMRFAVEMTPKRHPDATGNDDVVFMFSAVSRGDLRPVAQIASGGEISRLMLGIKSLIAGAVSLPAIIFDEIDAGISGETADRMGAILRRTGSRMQVIAISHLPQIAAKAEHQYLVFKNEDSSGAETHIRRLSTDERVTEIARILSGSNLSEAAIENARVLLAANG